MSRATRLVLWLYVALNIGLGAWFLLVPTSAAGIFPWPLPPLGARFMGALFLAGAACAYTGLALGASRGLMVLALVAVGDMLIAATGLLALDQVAMSSAMAIWLALFIGVAAVLLAVVLPAVPAAATGGPPIVTPSLRRYFRIHLCVVLPVGIAMFVAPVWAQPIWPWAMTPINIRLLGAFFAGAAIISFWCQRQGSWTDVLPALALYAVFASAATVASVVHFGLFAPERVITWVFFALYLFVAAGAWFWLATYPAVVATLAPGRQ
jgi:hypothetical protein